MLVSVLLMLLFYGLCLGALVCDGGYKRLRRGAGSLSLLQWAALALIATAFMAFVSYWPRQDRFVYFWDYAFYWGKSINRMRFMGENTLFEVFRTLYQSINKDDYNNFLPTLLAFPLQLLGCSFPRYVVVCCALFLLPTLFVQALIVAKLARHVRFGKGWLYVACVAVALCLPNNYYSVFRGFIDVAYLLPMSCAMYLLVDYDFRRISPVKNAIMAFLLVLIWVCRRYAVYLIVGYVVALGVRAVSVLIAEKSLKPMKAIAVNFLMIGLISIGFLLLSFRRFFLYALLTDFGQMYSAYNGTIQDKVMELVRTFGCITAAVMLVSSILCLVTARQVVNCIAMLAMIVIEPLLFWQTQNMGPQHRMILNIPIYVLCAMPLALCLDDGPLDGGRLPDKGTIIGKRLTAALCAVAMLCNFTMAFSDFLPATGCGTVFSERYVPYRRDDIEALNALAEKLNALTEGTKRHVYVAASGTVLNSDILKKLKMPEESNAVPSMYTTKDVDMRDGFPGNFLKAKYVVATDPIQLHLRTGQEVVSYLSALVQDPESYLGRHFKLIDEVALDEGVVALIYEKTGKFTEEDLQQLRNYYTSLYPGQEALFADRIK